MEALKKAPSWVQRVLLPELSEIKGDIRTLNTKLDEMDKRLSTSIDSMRNEMRAEILALDTKVDVLPRIAVLEAKLTEMGKRDE